MSTKQQFNADPDQCVVMHTSEMDWEDTENPGVSRKLLERVIDPEKGRETVLLRFAADTTLEAEELTERLDFFVLEGTYADGTGEYGPRTFVRHPAGTRHTPSSKDGCVLYAKRRNPIRDNDEHMVIDTNSVEWTAFPHRGADVVHFYRDPHGIETSRYGRIYPDKQIPEHDHAMGEETLIVDGHLMDEHDTYGPGSWFRFPIGVPHAPYTKGEDCTLLIREGDLVW